MAEPKVSSGVAVGIEFDFMGITFTGDILQENEVSALMASAHNVDLRNLLSEVNARLPGEIDHFPNLVINTLYLSFSMAGDNRAEFRGSVTIEDVQLGGDLEALGRTELLTIDFDIVLLKGQSEVRLNLHGSPDITLLGDIRCRTFELEFAWISGDRWKLGGRTVIGIHERDITLGASYESVKNREKRFLLYVDVVEDQAPLLSIPGLADLNPRSITLSVRKERGVKGISWDFFANGDLKLYQMGSTDNLLFNLENGQIHILDDEKKKEKGFKFNLEGAKLYPLGVFPDIPDSMKELFVIGLEEIHMLHTGELGWDFSAGLHLALNDVFKNNCAEAYDLIEKVLFPGGSTEQRLAGSLRINSKRGLEFVMNNTLPLIVPSLFDVLKLPEELKALDDIKHLFDIGATYFCLECIEIGIGKEFDCSATLALGLPSKLNDLFFGRNSALYGLVKTYDEKNEEKTSANLLRSRLAVDAEGFSGAIEEGNLIDTAVLDHAVDHLLNDQGLFNLKAGIKEEAEYITIDFDALFQENYEPETAETVYGSIRIKKPELKINTATGAFRASGGYEVSDPLMLPIRAVVEKILLLFQAVGGQEETGTGFLDFLPEGIPIRNIDFFPDNTFKMDELEEWLKQCLPPGIADLFALPTVFKQVVEQYAGLLLNRLPDAFKQYLQIKFPTAFTFSIDLTADGGVNFSIEVPDNEEDASVVDHAFSNCIQALIPIPDNTGMVYGVQLKKVALGAAFGGACLRLDLSARVDMFDLIQLGASLLLEDKSRVEDETLRLMLPDRRTLGRHFMVENLVMFIIYETVIPIPIPVYCSQIYFGYSGVEGLKSEFFIGNKAGLGLSVLKKLFELISFFKDRESTLSVDPYPYDASAGDEGLVVTAGPVYAQLPGFIGYEVVEKEKRNILLGTHKTHHFDLVDLVALVANTVKFTALNIVDLAKGKKPSELDKIKVASTDPDGEILKKPLNYLIEYLPVGDRMDFREVKLFYLFDFQCAWAFSTPDEFRTIVYPRMLAEYAKRKLPQTHGPSSADDLLQLLARCDGQVHTDEDQGVVLFLRGGLYCAQEKVVLEGAVGLSVSEHQGLRTGISLRGTFLNWIDSASFFFAQINPSSRTEFIKVIGSTYLKIFDREVLEGRIEVTNTNLKLQGMLDAFPSGFPLQLKGFVDGELSLSKVRFKGMAGLKMGLFHASAAVDLHIDKEHQFFSNDLIFANAYWHFAVEHHKDDSQEWFNADLSANAFNLIALEGHLRFKRDIGRLQLMGMFSIDFPQLNILHLRVDYRGEFNAVAGHLNLSARLSDGSYILSKDCRPTGGAAFHLWFDTPVSSPAATGNAAAHPPAGDFVLTIGGYHPNFKIPAHYPKVPRLGIHWKIDRHTQISGEAYFALTPLAIMVGSKLALVHQNGNIRAWFTAYVDFLCQWKPLSYDAKVGVSVGASYTLRVGITVFGKFIGINKTFSVSIKAQLHLWGPPTGGRIDIKLPIITIGINFGQKRVPPRPLKSWKEFKSAFLDNAKSEAAGQILQCMPLTGVSSVARESGTWIVRADELSFTVTTKVPASGVGGNSEQPHSPIHIKPLNRENITSTLTVTIEGDGKGIDAFDIENLTSNVPAAIWGKPGGNLLDSTQALIRDKITGIRLRVKEADRDANGIVISTTELGASESADGARKKLPDSTMQKTQRAKAYESLAALQQSIQDTAQARIRTIETLAGFTEIPSNPDFDYKGLCRTMHQDWQHCPKRVDLES